MADEKPKQKRMTRAEEIEATRNAVELAIRFLREHGYGVAADLIRNIGMFWIMRRVS